jgi:hypothetical protein
MLDGQACINTCGTPREFVGAMSRTVVLLLLLMSAEARGEGPWGIAAGAGPAGFRVDGTPLGDGLKLGASARLDAGYRVVDSVAVGAHLGIAYVEAKYSNSIAGQMTYVPFELGVGVQLVIVDRVLIAPWAGLLDTAEARLYAAGVALGYDVLERGRDRISAVATFTTARESFRDYPETYNSIGVGVAYRYW